MDHNQSRFYVLDLLLKDILSLIKPSENDFSLRENAIKEIRAIAQDVESMKDVVIRPFGSFASNLYTKWGDLDTSLELSHVAPNSIGKKRKQNLLRDFMKALRRKGVAYNFTFVPQARVPVLKFENKRYNISCDVSVDNHMGWLKSRILMQISEIDDRFRDVVLLTKEWAKAHHINDPKTGSLNSYSLCLLVIFHFQTCRPAILPPLKDIYEGNFADITGAWSIIERQIEDVCAANVARFKTFRQRNQTTLCELLISFFEKFSNIQSLSSEYVVCTHTGQWENMRSNPRWMKKSHSLLVEDPFERPDNAARAVSLKGISTISDTFWRTSKNLSSDLILSNRNDLLDIFLRSSISSQLRDETSNHYAATQINETPHIAYTGYAALASDHNQSQNYEKPKFAHTDYAVRGYPMEIENKQRRFHEKPKNACSGYVVDADNKQSRNYEMPNLAHNGYAVAQEYNQNRNYQQPNIVHTNYTASHYAVDNNQSRNYQQPNIVHTNYIVSHYAVDNNQSRNYQKPNIMHANYTASHYAVDNNRSQNGERSKFARAGYAVEEENNQSRNYRKPSIAPTNYTVDHYAEPSTSRISHSKQESIFNYRRRNEVAVADNKKLQSATSRDARQFCENPLYRHATVQEQQVWMPKNSNR